MRLPFDPAALSAEKLLEKIGGIYEHSPWIVQSLIRAQNLADCRDVNILLPRLQEVVENADEDAQLTLLRAHPDLAGRLAVAGALTEDSTSEQASAGLDSCTDAEFAEFTALNDRYKTQFGFPYILAVRGRNRLEILENFRQRVNNTRATEFREALDQVHQIARLRLEALC